MQLLGHMVSVCSVFCFLKTLTNYFLDSLYHFTVPPAMHERSTSSTFLPVSGIVAIFILSFNRYILYIWICDPLELILCKVWGLGWGSFLNFFCTFFKNQFHCLFLYELWAKNVFYIFYILNGWKKTENKAMTCEKSYEIQIQCPEIKFYWNTTPFIQMHCLRQFLHYSSRVE